MRLRYKFSAVILLIIFSGCATLTVNVDYDPAANFSGLTTYTWMPGSQIASKDPRINKNPAIRSRVENTVAAQLAAHGFVQDESGAPDFLVGYYVTVGQKIDVVTLNRHYGYRSSNYGRGYRHGGWRSYQYRGYQYRQRGVVSGPSTFVQTYQEGTLVLDIVDPETKQLIWRAYAQDQVNFSEELETRQKKLDEAVSQMLEQFPPRGEE